MTNMIYIYNEAASSSTITSLILEKGLSNLFLKLDCEGCENEVILNMTNGAYRAIQDIVMEYHDNPDPIIDRLTAQGFTIRKSSRHLAREGLLTANKC